MKYRFLLILLLAAQWIAARRRYATRFSLTMPYTTRPGSPLLSRPCPVVGKDKHEPVVAGPVRPPRVCQARISIIGNGQQGENPDRIRPDPYSWLVTGHDGTVNVTYTLFGNRADGTYTGITSLYAHLNMPATFMWAEGLENRPVEVTFNLPAGKNWNVATQLKPESGTTFSAPHLQYFMDSPTHIGHNLLREWTVNDRGKTKTIQLALHHNGTNAEADAYADRIKKVVQEQQAIFGELPDYDFGRYTFLATYLPQADGDGMEHRNSTVLTSNSSLRQNAGDLLGTVSHEFFHAWNVERIRPATLEPFKFMEANMSGELWFAEGFTNYYGGLVLVRTGDESMGDYAKRLTFVANYLDQFSGEAVLQCPRNESAGSLCGRCGFHRATQPGQHLYLLLLLRRSHCPCP